MTEYAIEMTEYAIELSGITKAFGPVVANNNVDLAVERGSIHGIVGENGAGKSTLMSILYGFYTPDTGTVSIMGKPLQLNSSQAAIEAGIGMVHQHFMLVDTFTVLENVILGAEGGFSLDEPMAKAEARLKELSEKYNLSVDPQAVVSTLPVGVQQRVEILKALYRGADILILDEPTGVLTPQEADQLFEIMRNLKAQGVTIVLITHKLREIMDITDNVSVMRLGEMVAHKPTTATSPEDLAELMVGRKVLLDIEKQAPKPGDVALNVDDLSFTDDRGVSRLKNVSFSVRRGEIVGIAGVSGNGQSQLLSALSGMIPPTSGTISYGDRHISADAPSTPREVRDLNVAHVPEDRQKLGLVTAFEAWESSVLGYETRSENSGPILMKNSDIHREAQGMMDRFDVRPNNPRLGSAKFSGGNQQKLVLAREIEKQPDVLLVGQPTRGVDIGAIEFIHKQIIAMRDAGKAVLLISVELDEIMGLADRILVMFDGEIVGEVSAEEADERTLGLMMANAYQEDAA